MDNLLNSKTVLITGSQGLLGRTYVDTVLDNGGKVIACDISGFDEIENGEKPYLFSKKYKNMIYYICDITNELNVKKMFKNLSKLNFLPNSLINNAARNPKLENIDNKKGSFRLENFSLEEFKLDLDVSLIGSFLCSKYLYINAIENNISKINIINISSDLGIISPDQRLYSKDELNPNYDDPVKPISYSICKHGIHGLTKYLATYDPLKMRSNTLYPGGVYTNQNTEFLERINRRIPLSKMAETNSYIGAIKFLLGDESSYMTGSQLVIDGGRTTW